MLGLPRFELSIDHAFGDQLLINAIFDDAERGPDDDLKLQFEAICRLPDADKQAVKLLLEGVILKHQTKQMVSNLSG